MFTCSWLYWQDNTLTTWYIHQRLQKNGLSLHHYRDILFCLLFFIIYKDYFLVKCKHLTLVFRTFTVWLQCIIATLPHLKLLHRTLSSNEVNSLSLKHFLNFCFISLGHPHAWDFLFSYSRPLLSKKLSSTPLSLQQSLVSLHSHDTYWLY